MLDRSAFGGATTRNAGFACFGSPSELAEDLESLGTDALVKLVDMRWSGLNAMRASWSDVDLGYSSCGAIEAFTDCEQFERIKGMLPELNALLESVLGSSAFQVLSDSEVQQRGLQNMCGAISSPLEGALDAAAMVRAMRKSLFKQDIEVIHGIEATALGRELDGWCLRTKAGGIQTQRVFVCTNAWASSLLDLDVAPAPNVVVVSQPLQRLALNNTFTTTVAMSMPGKYMAGCSSAEGDTGTAKTMSRGPKCSSVGPKHTSKARKPSTLSISGLDNWA